MSYDWNYQRQKIPTGIASALKRCYQHLNSQEKNSSSEWKCLVLPPSICSSSMSPWQLSLPDWRCQGCQRRGFSSPHVSPQSQNTHLTHLSSCQLSLPA
uniref:Uncharacterized protein n=1 Tax=Serinus canaria TaxID=9135 RepID=A0A8C9NH59_SERCA